MSEKVKAVVLLSGGLDSTTCMAVAQNAGEELYPISFNYHQRHSIELESAKKVAAHYAVSRHLIVETNMEAIGGSALTDESIEVPEGDVHREDIPVTYVPARNLIFLSYALGYAETLGAGKVYIGVNSVDYSGYPDCRPEFIEKFQAIADYATAATAVKGAKITIAAPLQNMSKAEIIRLAARLKAPLEHTHSCYRGGDTACGVCDSCKLRLQGFAAAGIKDPVSYENR
ncbi:7-cyano-7-deazaguanine synthase QueC [Selenomonas sp. TAMA-11512]|uniref:7-cyano-7-deazaguanine synthase QueC n=1 Tax=Selenomonas sp. TAMA-11512 TaxID=3095337 RepID=UPI0030CB8EC1